MKKQQPDAGAPRKENTTAVDDRAAQPHREQSQAGPLAAANVEESPHMDRGDSALGAGESLSHSPGSSDEAERKADSRRTAESLRRGALDTQYGTKSSMKTGQPGRTGAAAAETAKGGDRAPSAPNPGSSEESSGAERDTMTGPRPGSGS